MPWTRGRATGSRARARRGPFAPLTTRQTTLRLPHDQGSPSHTGPGRPRGAGRARRGVRRRPGQRRRRGRRQRDREVLLRPLDRRRREARAGRGPTPRCPSRPSTPSASRPSARRRPKPAKGQPKVTDAQLKTQCKQEYEQLRDQVLQLLISFQWLEGEANEQGIKVSDAEVKKSFEQQKKQSFPKAADYEKFLKDSGQSEADILLQVKADLLASKIRDKVVKGKDKVSDAQIQDFYDKNKAALRAARAPRPARRADQGRGQGQGREEGARRAARAGSPWRRSTRSTRPPRRRAASCPRRPRARSRSSSTRRSSRPPRAS